MENIEFARSVCATYTKLYRTFMSDSKSRPTKADKQEYLKFYSIIKGWCEQETDKKDKQEFLQILKKLQDNDITLVMSYRKKGKYG